MQLLCLGLVVMRCQPLRRALYVSPSIEDIMIERAVGATLYLDVLIPWEQNIKEIDQKGNFDIRAKGFTAFKRSNNLKVQVKKNVSESDLDIKNYISLELLAENVLILSKGDSSTARSILRHFRNSIAHGHVKKQKIKHANYLVFSASNNNQHQFYLKIRQSLLKTFIAALMSTVKHV
ncbi:hypothetical protein JG630_16195 [Vibrio cholerae]|nr:hypothetical protein [Vibrio cholerae]